MQVTLYKAKLNANNRCYDKTAYDSYLSSLDKVVVNIPADVVPNTTFYVNKSQTTWQLYSYMTFEYAGLKYASFIADVQPLASNGTIAISHTTDWWYYVCENNLPISFHGQCVRAHVNDWKYDNVTNAYYPTLDNTYDKPEEQISTNGYKMSSEKIVKTNKDYRFVYMVINQVPQEGISVLDGDDISQYLTYHWFGGALGEWEQLSLTNTLILGIIDNTGTVSFKFSKPSVVPTEQEIKDCSIKLKDIQSDAISGLTISDLNCDRLGCTVAYITNSSGKKLYYFKTQTDYIYSYDTFMLNCSLKWLPKQIYGLRSFESKSIDINLPLYYCENLHMSKGTYPALNYERYKNYGITKMHTSPYTNISIAGNIVNYFYNNRNNLILNPVDGSLSGDQNLTTEMLLFPTLSVVSISVQYLEYYDQRTEYFLVNNVTSFKPFVTRSFADSIDIELAGLNAERKEVNAGFGVAKSTLSTGVGIGKIFSGDFSGIGGALTGAIDTAQSIVNLDYTVRENDLTLRKAQGQYFNGNISSDTATGYYSTITKLDWNNITFLQLNDLGKEQLFPLLHRYGYNTPLQLDEVYKNHRRKYFNYIQTADSEITGVPLKIANDIKHMFDSGVHLWSGTVDEWEVPNIITVK